MQSLFLEDETRTCSSIGPRKVNHATHVRCCCHIWVGTVASMAVAPLCCSILSPRAKISKGGGGGKLYCCPLGLHPACVSHSDPVCVVGTLVFRAQGPGSTTDPYPIPAPGPTNIPCPPGPSRKSTGCCAYPAGAQVVCSRAPPASGLNPCPTQRDDGIGLTCRIRRGIF